MVKKSEGAFCPVDEGDASLSPGKVVRTDAEFEGFIAWLRDPAAQELRGRAYARIAGGEPTVAAKAALIDAACGDYLAKLVRQANRNATWGLSEDAGDDEREAMQRRVAQGKAKLARFCAAVKPQLFEGQLARADMSAEAIARLLSSFDAQAASLAGIASVLALNAKRLGQQAKAELPGLLRAYLEDPRRRGEVKAAADGEPAPEGAEALGLFAPLIKFIEQEVDPAVRMEMAAHFEDYVRSGWFARDCVDGATGPGCQEGAWWGARHDSAPAFRAIMGRLGEGEDVPREEVAEAFAARVAELALSVECRSKQVAGAPSSHWIRKVEKLDARSLFRSVAGSGRPDSFWISPDGERMLITCATSDETMAKQGNQMARYLRAASAAVARGKLGPHIEMPIDFAPRVEARAFAVSFAQEKSRKPGAQAGGSLLKCFEAAGEAEEGAMVRAFNALPFLGTLASDAKGFEPAALGQFRIDLLGAKEEIWEPARAMADAAPEQSKHSAGLLALAKALGNVGAALGAAKMRPGVAYNAHAGGIGSKAFRGLKSLRQFSGYVLSLRSGAAPLERAAMDRALAPGAPALARVFKALAERSEGDEKVLLSALLGEFAALGGLAAPAGEKAKPSRRPARRK